MRHTTPQCCKICASHSAEGGRLWTTPVHAAHTRLVEAVIERELEEGTKRLMGCDGGGGGEPRLTAEKKSPSVGPGKGEQPQQVNGRGR